MIKFVTVLAIFVTLPSCYIERGVQRCEGWGIHSMIEITPHIPVKNGELIIFACNRKDAFGNASCNYKDTFFLKNDHRVIK